MMDIRQMIIEAIDELLVDMDGLKNQARKIIHCGDCGLLFWNAKERKVWWCAGDSDGSDDETTSLEDIEKMLKVRGVNKVEIEGEAYPFDLEDERNGENDSGYVRIRF